MEPLPTLSLVSLLVAYTCIMAIPCYVSSIIPNSSAISASISFSPGWSVPSTIHLCSWWKRHSSPFCFCNYDAYHNGKRSNCLQ